MTDSNGRRVNLPGSDEHYIILPPEWLGEHLEARDRAIAAGIKAGLIGDLLNFAAAVALLHDWNLPNMPRNRDLWQPREIRAGMIKWIINAVLPDLAADQVVEKKS